MARRRWWQAALRWTAAFVFVMGVGFALMGVSAFITIRIITLRQTIPAPDLRGHTVEEALRIVERHQLRLRVHQPGVYSETIPPQRIAHQTPEPGTLIKPGRSIVVHLSLGAAKVQVPNLMGKPLRSARMALQQLGLTLGPVLYVQMPGKADQVLHQTPAPATMVPNGTSVLLVVNLGREPVYIMPDVIGQPLEPVLDFFKRRRYRVSQVASEFYPGLPPGIIIRQRPQGGFPLRKTDIITLVVSRAP